MAPERKERETRVGRLRAPGVPGIATLTLAKVTVPLQPLAVVSGNWSHLTGKGVQV